MKKLNVIKIGKKLQSIRRANGYTQEKLAEKIDLNESFLSNQIKLIRYETVVSN